MGCHETSEIVLRRVLDQVQSYSLSSKLQSEVGSNYSQTDLTLQPTNPYFKSETFAFGVGKEQIILSIDLSQHFLLDGDLNSDTVSLCVMLKFAGGGMEHTLSSKIGKQLF